MSAGRDKKGRFKKGSALARTLGRKGLRSACQMGLFGKKGKR